jgi:hypothetical protein
MLKRVETFSDVFDLYKYQSKYGKYVGVHSFTGAYSPEWTFGLPLRVS